MKLARHIAYLFLLLVTMSLGASAQEPNGKFTVKHDTRWGTAVLPAGSYSVAVRNGPVPYVLVTSDDRSAVSIMAVAQYVETAQCKSSSLELEQADGNWNVRSLCFESSLAVYFAPSQKTRQTNVAAVPQVATLAGSN
jgi:hypothetical protein